MSNSPESANAPYTTQYFPQHIGLLTVGENIMPIGHWTVISKDPFRLLLAMEMGNHSYTLLQKYQEAAFHFMPWVERLKPPIGYKPVGGLLYLTTYHCSMAIAN